MCLIWSWNGLDWALERSFPSWIRMSMEAETSRPSSESNLTRTAIVRCPTDPSEWVLLELQGVFVPRTGNSLQGLEIGKLRINPVTITFMILIFNEDRGKEEWMLFFFGGKFTPLPCLVLDKHLVLFLYFLFILACSSCLNYSWRFLEFPSCFSLRTTPNFKLDSLVICHPLPILRMGRRS